MHTLGLVLMKLIPFNKMPDIEIVFDALELRDSFHEFLDGNTPTIIRVLLNENHKFSKVMRGAERSKYSN